MPLWDIFVHERATGQTTLVSRNSAGQQANYYASEPAISTDGRFVVFQSPATNLVPSDDNHTDDIFLRDRALGQTTIVSIASDGTQADWLSWGAAISGDGRLIPFISNATTLVADDTNEQADIFCRDRGRGEATTVVELPSSGGSFTSWPDHTIVWFPSGTFTATATITYTAYTPGRYTPPGGLDGIGHYFDLTAVHTATGQSAQPLQAYTIIIGYADAELSSVDEETLALYYWTGSGWVKEATSLLDKSNHNVSASPDHFSSWAVLGEVQRIYLPLILRSG
jgi:hypothetical protein